VVVFRYPENPEQFFIKRFQHEQDQLFLLIVDTSLRMDYGTPSKWERMMELAATFAFFSLSQKIRLKILSVSHKDSPDFRHFRELHHVFRYLIDLPPSSQGSIAQTLRRSLAFKAQHTLLLSDLFEPEVMTSFQVLRQRKHALAVIQMLSSEEQNPQWKGLCRLQSKETQQVREERLTLSHLKKYQEFLQQYQKQLKHFCHHHRIPFVYGLSHDSLEHWIEKLSQEGNFFSS
jgi:uncharacterized protein (DUF58 family)